MADECDLLSMRNTTALREQTDRREQRNVRQHCWKPVDPVGVRHHRDDRHIQLSVCLHTLYAGHETDLHGRTLRENSAVFSAFILFETWPMPVAGYFVDKFGIRKLMTFGAICIALGWVLGGTIAKSPLDLYIYYGVIAGTGAGIIYISCVANAVKWFPDRRGLAVGLTAAGFGGGAALTDHAHCQYDPQHGMGQGDGCLGAWPGHHCFRRCTDTPPSAGRLGSCWVGPARKTGTQGRRAVEGELYLDPNSWKPEFYLLYTMFFFACAGGLIATAKPFTDCQVSPCERREDMGSRDCSAGRNPDVALQRSVQNRVGLGLGPAWGENIRCF